MHKNQAGLAVIAMLLCGCSTPYSLPGKGVTDTTQAVYRCDDGQRLEVTYYNNQPNALAVIKKGDGPEIVMANVISGSGAKYNGNTWQWWSKGRSGIFSDLMKDTTTECQAIAE
ncbi:MliC family protein [Pantoea sp. FN0305]|uniref:MliC family protein n=1 Tax=Pantoea sp. FN0305 TaxID=3418559 RepID=UPI003CE9017D